MTQDASIVKSDGGTVPIPSGRGADPLDMSRFRFVTTIVELDKTGAWTLDGQVAMAFGSGASQIGARAGVSITKPLKVNVGNTERDNPYLEHDSNGSPSILWMRKVGVYLDKHGLIRYTDLTDRIDVVAYMAERATKLMNSNDKSGAAVVGNSGRYCTKVQAQGWNANSKEPGKDVWWFIPTQGTEIGVAFNLADRVYRVNKFQEEMIHFRKTILRRFETATDRRVIASLIPESLKTTDFESDYNQQYKSYKMKKARFKVESPEGHGFELGIFQQIARALKEDNAEMRETAFTAFKKMSGFEEVKVREMPTETLPDPITITQDLEPARVIESEAADEDEIIEEENVELGVYDPVPSGQLSMDDFRSYVKGQVPHLTDEHVEELRKILGLEKGEGPLHDFKGKDKAKEVRNFFKEIAGREESANETGEVTPDMMRKYLGEQLAKENKQLTNIMYGRYGDEWTLDSISDVEVQDVYKALHAKE